MKTNEIIKNLQKLKNVEPSKLVLKEIENNIYQEIGFDKRESVLEDIYSLYEKIVNFIGRKYLSFGLTVTTVFIILVAAFSLLFPYRTHDMVLNTKLTFATNQYEKARIVLLDTESRYSSRPSDESQIQLMSNTLAQTNSEMSNLKLVGEQGKYTSDQCQSLYREYLNYLENQNYYLSTDNDPSSLVLKQQISEYIEQAETKLRLY